MSKRDREKLSLLMREMRDRAVAEGCWTDIRSTFNQIVNTFNLPGSTYEPLSQPVSEEK